MANGKKQGSDLGDWIVIAILFAIGIWPVALFLMFKKLFGKDDREEREAPPLYEKYQQVTNENTLQRESGQNAGRPAQQVRSAQWDAGRNARGAAGSSGTAGAKPASASTQKMMRTPAAKSSTAKWLSVIGIVLLAAGTFASISSAQVMLQSMAEASRWLPDLLELLKYMAVTIAGGAMLGGGLSMSRSLKRYAKYLAVMGEREAVSVAELSRVLGYSERTVEKDLQKMLDKGYFGGRAYLNMELGYLFRSSEADIAWKKQQEAKAAVPKEAEEGYSGILRSIRRANDRIADPSLSAKIDRLEEITAKIFREVEAHPEKQSRISTFLTYYLPTTQKLLDSYADFESAGVEGENLRQAKSRIEDTMDSIIRGFEHQLDALYRADAMDVDSDIRVMETMLRRDTATVEDDFGLGTAVQAEDE